MGWYCSTTYYTGLADDTLKNEALQSVEGSYFTNHYSLDDPAENIQEALSLITESFITKDAIFLCMDMMLHMIDAIEETGAESQKIIDPMRSIDYSGIAQVKFDENNNPIKAVSTNKSY